MATLWQRVKSGSKTGFDRAYNTLDKLGPPVNKLSNKLGSEAFWPTTLDKESDKAARILRSFCKDGFYTEEEVQPDDDGPRQKQRVVKKIPAEVIRNAKGLAVFTTMRTGLWFSGAGGAGVLIARMQDGGWSPPSGIMLHTAGLGFLVGVDIYDCVVVINTQEGLDAFSKLRCTLGGEVAVTAGPVGAGGILESEVHKRQAPIFTYLKSRGFYAGVQIDGTIVVERTDENERFYGERVSVGEILKGNVRHPPLEVRRLLETVRAAQGDKDVDESMVPNEPPPGDLEIDDGSVFGVPEKDDPDPYGVLALEREGMGLVEAGTKKRASWQEFDFHPAPSSPIFSSYSRNSQDRDSKSIRATMSRHNSWRASAFSSMNGTVASESKPTSSLRPSMDRARPSYAESSTQTDFPDDELPVSAGHSRKHSRTSSKDSIGSASGLDRRRSSPMQGLPENGVLNVASPLAIGEGDQKSTSTTTNGYTTPPHTPPGTSQPHNPYFETHSTSNPQHDSDAHTSASDDNDSDDSDEDEPTIHSVSSVQTAQTAQSIHTAEAASPQKQQAPASPQRGLAAKARLVTVPKRLPPKLPARNPNRAVRGGQVGGLSVPGTPTGERALSPAGEGLEMGIEKVSLKDDVEEDKAGIEMRDEEREGVEKVVEPEKVVREERPRQSVEEERARMPGGW